MAKRVFQLARFVTVSLAVAFLASAAFPAALALSQVPGNPVRIDALDATFSIDHHFATTKVREVLTNPSDASVEFVAALAVPDLAFVTRFALETGGRTYESRIEDASSARAAYNETAAASSAAALVEGRGTHTYQVSLNLPASTTVTVHLSYEQLVTRSGDRFEYRFPLMASAAGKTIGFLSVGGALTGRAAVSSPAVSLGSLEMPSPRDLRASHFSSHLVPSADYLLTWSEDALKSVGTVLAHTTAQGGLFLHSFSPEAAGVSLTPIPKDIVFVLDISGSMDSSLPQVKTVFSSIIGDLVGVDRFSVVAFAGSYSEWSKELSAATPANRKSAIDWVNDLDAKSSTNLDLGLHVGISKLPRDASRAPTVLLLTDGEPTSGVTDATAIRSNLQVRNTMGASVYALAFGPHADFALLNALALENGGEARRIFLGQDAGEQIRGFYDSISAPLLSDVTFTYTEDDLPPTSVHFARAFQGADLTAVGTLQPGATVLKVEVTASSADGPIRILETFDPATLEAGAFVERAWAFERVRALAGPAALGDREAILDLVAVALKYSFVTDFTSLVVVVPPTLSNGHVLLPVPMRVTTSSALTPSEVQPLASPYAATPSRSTPGPGAALALLGLAAASFALARGSRARAR